MTSKLYSCFQLLLLLGSLTRVVGQANTALSNLTSPTSINQDLIPATTNIRGLGTVSRSWKNVYVGTAVYLKNTLTIHASGTENFFMGSLSGNTSISGSYNTGIGVRTLALTTSGGSNMGIGYNVLLNNKTGSRNTATGHKALHKNTSGNDNTASGEAALFGNTTGSFNVAMGARAMFNSTTGAYNIAIGNKSLFTNSTGNYNTGSGHEALYSNTTGSFNNAIGYQSLRSNTTGNYNQADGAYSLYFNSGGSANSANGYAALYQNTTGNNNTAAGFYSMLVNSTGSNNTAAGYYSMYSNTSGAYNTAAGVYALNSNTTASYNSAFGYNALYSSTTAFYNSAFGSLALSGTTTGGYNTAVGRRALEANTTGTFNTAIGYDAGSVVATLTNTTAVGNGARPLQSNQVWLGNTSVTSIRAAAGFVIMSDGRFKKDLNENVPGLEFINLLKPVTYTYDVHGIDKRMRGNTSKRKEETEAQSRTANDIEERAINEKEKIVYTGFVAQQVEKAAAQIKYDFSGVYKPQNESDIYGLNYADFVVPLVKAVQQLSKQNDSLQEQNAILEARLAKIESYLKIPSSGALALTGGYIGQNSPNPVRSSTVISYTLPQQYSKAILIIYDATGKTIKQFGLSGTGNSTLRIDASGIASGEYNYSMYIDNVLVDTKKMIVIK